jgi:hypothetical protein
MQAVNFLMQAVNLLMQALKLPLGACSPTANFWAVWAEAQLRTFGLFGLKPNYELLGCLG